MFGVNRSFRAPCKCGRMGRSRFRLSVNCRLRVKPLRDSRNKVSEALQEYIVKPDVIVSLQSVQSRKYFITGEVSRPGTFPLVVP